MRGLREISQEYIKATKDSSIYKGEKAYLRLHQRSRCVRNGEPLRLI